MGSQSNWEMSTKISGSGERKAIEQIVKKSGTKKRNEKGDRNWESKVRK